MISLVYCKTQCLYLPIFCLVFGLIHLKALASIISFLSFKEITHAYLLSISVTHNKNVIPLFNLLINCISAKSPPERLFIKVFPSKKS